MGLGSMLKCNTLGNREKQVGASLLRGDESVLESKKEIQSSDGSPRNQRG